MRSALVNLRLDVNDAAGVAVAPRQTRGAVRAADTPLADEGRMALITILLVQTVLLLSAARFVGAYGWDDGAITLAYARTFAETGRIALTSVSEHVEGFSSVAWFGLNALVQLARPGFSAAIFASQLLTLITLVASGAVVYRLGRAIGLHAATCIAAVGCFACMGPLFSETVNGMEMGLLTLGGLVIVHRLYFDRNQLVVSVALGVFVATRFESAFYVAFLLAPLLFEHRFREFTRHAALAALVFGVIGAYRWFSFGALLPNTIYAKMHEPYHAHGFALWSRVFAAGELFILFLPALIVLLLRALYLRRCWGVVVALKNNRALLAPIAGAVIFALITGRNWGYLGRMQFFAIPFMLLLIVQTAEWLAMSSPVGQSAFVGCIVGLTLCSSTLGAPIEQWRARWTHSFSVAPASYRETALAVEKVRTTLGAGSIAFLTGDIGGVGLCCPAIRVVDIALLSNQKLAREGYGALADVIGTEQPEIIEAHGLWASVSHLYQLDSFRTAYRPAIIDHTRFYLRNDVADRLAQTGIATTVSIDHTDAQARWADHRYRAACNERDDEAFRSTGAVLLVR
jgi:hypothetical protein